MKKNLLLLGSLLGIIYLVIDLRAHPFGYNDLIPTEPPGSVFDQPMATDNFIDKSILSEPFTFIGDGNQASVFASSDGKYVLKLLKYRYPKLRIGPMAIPAKAIPLEKMIYSLCYKKEQKKQAKHDFQSYCNAFHHFQKQTLVEYVHLTTTTHLQTPLQLIDKKGKCHILPADTTAFVIQQKVDILGPALDKLLQAGQSEDALILLRNLRSFIQERANKGFYFPTHKVNGNFGCIGLTPIQIDIGRLLFPSDLEQEEKVVAKEPIDRLYIRLKPFLESKYPSLLSFLEEETTP